MSTPIESTAGTTATDADNTDYGDVAIDHQWASRYRIPLVTGIHVERSYEVALCVPAAGEQPNQFVPSTLWPEEDEARVVGSAIDFRRSYYTDHWQRRMLAHRLDYDPHTNPVILVKQSDGWRYHKPTWRDQMWSIRPKPGTAAGLIELLDCALSGPDWDRWKLAHPDVFAAGQVTAR